MATISSLLNKLRSIKSGAIATISEMGGDPSSITNNGLDKLSSAIATIPTGGGSDSEPSLVGWINASDLSQFLDLNGDDSVNIMDITYGYSAYSPSYEPDLGSGHTTDYVDGLLTQSGPAARNQKKGYELTYAYIDWDLYLDSEEKQYEVFCPVLVCMSTEGDRWAIVDFGKYIKEDALTYGKYAVYNGKPNLAQIAAG